jgi:hypothetical protein
MWGDILATNSSETVAALDALVEKLTAVRDELRDWPARGGELKITHNLFSESASS